MITENITILCFNIDNWYKNIIIYIDYSPALPPDSSLWLATLSPVAIKYVDHDWRDDGKNYIDDIDECDDRQQTMISPMIWDEFKEIHPEMPQWKQEYMATSHKVNEHVKCISRRMYTFDVYGHITQGKWTCIKSNCISRRMYTWLISPQQYKMYFWIYSF